MKIGDGAESDRTYQLTKQELQNIEQIIDATPKNVLRALESRDPSEMRRAIRFVDRMDRDARKVLADIRTYQAKADRNATRLSRLMYICRMHNVFVTADDLDSDEPVPRDSLRLDPWPPASVGTKLRRRNGRAIWSLGEDGRWHRNEAAT